MTVDDAGVGLARQATEALRRLDDHGHSLRPDGVDHFTWSADVLDELARLAETIGRAVERVSGESAPGAESHAHAQALATAIVADRNSLLRHGGGHHPFPDGGDQLPEVIAGVRPGLARCRCTGRADPVEPGTASAGCQGSHARAGTHR